MNYARLVQAQNFFDEKGYTIVDAPWEVEREVNEITKPSDTRHLQLYPGSGNALVASAEQSFLQLRADGKLSNGRYQAITPCFRDEAVDETHKQMFMKLELIVISDKLLSEADVHTVMYDAKIFMQSQGMSLQSRFTDEAQYARDLECQLTGIELGSYGMRHHPKIGYWVYGTGLAEPRFSYVQEQRTNLLKTLEGNS